MIAINASVLALLLGITPAFAQQLVTGAALDIAGSGASVLPLSGEGYTRPKNFIGCLGDSAPGELVNGVLVDASCLEIQQVIGGGLERGPRSTLSLNTEILSNAGTSVTGGSFYPSILSTISIGADQGGSAGAEVGNIYGIGTQVTARSGATNLGSVAAAEFDVSVQPGATTAQKWGVAIVSYNSDAVHGYGHDAGIWITTGGPDAAGFRCGFCLGDLGNNWPIPPEGTIIGTYGKAGAAGDGIDFSHVRFSGFAFQSPGFWLDGQGRVTMPSMPTSCPANAAGMLWNNKGVVSIC